MAARRAGSSQGDDDHSAGAANRPSGRTQSGPAGEDSRRIDVSSTTAQNQFGSLLDQVAKGKTVFIRKRNVPHAVLISVERYEELTRSDFALLDGLESKFDALLARIRNPGARAAADVLFSATPEQLGAAAFESLRKRDG